MKNSSSPTLTANKFFRYSNFSYDAYEKYGESQEIEETQNMDIPEGNGLQFIDASLLLRLLVTWKFSLQVRTASILTLQKSFRSFHVYDVHLRALVARRGVRNKCYQDVGLRHSKDDLCELVLFFGWDSDFSDVHVNCCPTVGDPKLVKD